MELNKSWMQIIDRTLMNLHLLILRKYN